VIGSPSSRPGRLVAWELGDLEQVPPPLRFHPCRRGGRQAKKKPAGATG